MFKIATVHLGISSFVFWGLTFRELNLMFEEHHSKYKKDMETLVGVVRVGYVNARTGKNYKLFDDDDEMKTNLIDPEEKRKTLDGLKADFSK